MSASEHRSDGGRGDRAVRSTVRAAFDVEELRSRNPSAVAMDVLYLFATAFFTHLFVQGFWPAVIAAAPLGAILYFGWHSSKPFFAAQILAAAASVVATYLGLVPV